MKAEVKWPEPEKSCCKCRKQTAYLDREGICDECQVIVSLENIAQRLEDMKVTQFANGLRLFTINLEREFRY